jgi:hypothetical protein
VTAPRRSTPPKPRIAKYADIRAQIRDGDILLLRGYYASSRIFERLTNAAYSHATIAIWWNDRLMLLQAESAGVQAVPLSVAIGTYEGRCDWYPLRREAVPEIDANLPAVIARAKAYTGLPYGYWNLCKKLFKRLLGIHLYETPPEAGMFCSQFVAEAFKNAGLPLLDREAIDTWPKDIVMSKLVSYGATIAHDPAALPRRLNDYIPPGPV